MFGISGFGDLPFSTIPDVRIRVEANGFFYPDYKPLEISVNAGATINNTPENRLFAATDDYISWPSDRIPNRIFDGTLSQPLRFQRSITGGGGFSGYTFGLGEMILNNEDGSYDYLTKGYAVDGRNIVVKMGDGDMSYDTFGVIFDGQATRMHVSESEFVIELRDFGYALEVPALPNVYSGTGGAEGGEDMKDKRKPRCFGVVRNITPAALSLNQSLLFQVHDGSVDDIPAVYSRGVSLPRGADYPTPAALIDAALTDSRYLTCLAYGMFRLRFLLDDDRGAVTCDVRGDNAGGFVQTTADIIRRIVTTTTEVTRLDLDSFLRVNIDQPAVVGYYIEADSNIEVASVCTDLMAAIGGWAGFRRNGNLELGILSKPSGAPVASFTDFEIISASRDALPNDIDPPAYRYRIGWGRNWTPMDDESLAGSVAQERRDFLAEEFRYGIAEDYRIKFNHPLANDPDPMPAWFDDAAAAQAEAGRRLALYRDCRSLYTFSLKTQAFALDIGRVFHVTYPRWDLVAGKLLVVVSIDEDTENNTIQIQGFG